MQTLTMFISLSLMPILLLQPAQPNLYTGSQSGAHTGQSAKQLLAVRGTIANVKTPAKGELQLTIKPAKDFAEVIVLARENDLVGSAARRARDNGGLGLFGGSANDNEILTAAELDEGDIISVIYDPQLQNRALEIYIH
jgi:hypothetical protein